jgi:molecular chaperone GrpE
MTETKEPASPATVSDKRRFDAEGNPRASAPVETQDNPDETTALPSKEASASIAEAAGLKGELEAAYARIDTLARAYQEMERDKEEFKRRIQRERDRMLGLEKGKVALLVIEAIDELELCLKNADASPLSVGVRMIRENLLKKLKENNVVSLELEGTVFNPNFAEAVDMQRVDNPEDNMKILEVLRPGYAFKEQVLRPARVRVAHHP